MALLLFVEPALSTIAIRRSLAEAKLPQLLKKGDLILSRKTAPLIKMCSCLLTKGIQSHIAGKNVAEELVRLGTFSPTSCGSSSL